MLTQEGPSPTKGIVEIRIFVRNRSGMLGDGPRDVITSQVPSLAFVILKNITRQNCTILFHSYSVFLGFY